MNCEAHVRHRDIMFHKVHLDTSLSCSEKLDILLGKTVGDLKIDETTDLAVKRFLKKAWRNRKTLILQANKIFDRNDTPQRGGKAGTPQRAKTRSRGHSLLFV